MSQETALDILKLGHNVFLTGAAGSGKSYVLNQYIEYLKKERVSVGITASTGIAATQVNGITINSWAGIGIKHSLSESDLHELGKRPYLRKRISKTNVLIIDEVSMLPQYVLDMVDQVCQLSKKNHQPFGGMQVVLCGDFFQLPPIEKNGEWRTENEEKRFESLSGLESDLETGEKQMGTPFVHKSQAWERMNLKICYLDTEYRQEDETFLHVLHEIRDNAITKPSIKTLAQRLYQPVTTITTRLYTHNVNVDAMNNRELDRLSGTPHTFSMTGKGNEYLLSIMKKSCLAPEQLVVKLGAQVMFVKNNFDKGYVNGTLGKVVDFDSRGYPMVETAAGEIVTATPAEWMIEEDGEVKASIRQIPLRLAWAITIHKSQGMSIDAAEIDLGRPFTPGMGYVALSRVRRLEGIRLMGLNHKALVVNEEVLVLDKALKAKSEAVEKEMEQIDWFEMQIQQMMFVKDLQCEEKAQNQHSLSQEYLYGYFDQ